MRLLDSTSFDSGVTRAALRAGESRRVTSHRSRRAGPRFFETAEEFRAWLEEHHATEKEILVGFHKKGPGRPSITWPESVDEALCFGWIDGVRRSLGEESYTIRFTPRKPSSIWSADQCRAQWRS